MKVIWSCRGSSAVAPHPQSIGWCFRVSGLQATWCARRVVRRALWLPVPAVRQVRQTNRTSERANTRVTRGEATRDQREPGALLAKAVSRSAARKLDGNTTCPAEGRKHALDALGMTALTIRNQLGESLATAQKFDTLLEQVTMPPIKTLPLTDAKSADNLSR